MAGIAHTRVLASVVLVACLAGSLTVPTAGASRGWWAHVAQRAALAGAPVGRGGGLGAVAAGRLARSRAVAQNRAEPGHTGTVGRGAWATLPAGLRAALAHLHLEFGSAGGAGRRAAWAPGARGLHPSAIRPSCQCGGGGPTWSQQAELADPNGLVGDDYSWSVALSSNGNIALIGAPYLNNYTGAAYAFVNTGNSWLEAAVLTASDAASGDEFGASVALSSDGSTLLIGAPYRNTSSGHWAGAAYVFTPLPYFGYGQQAELTAWDGANYDTFGWSVALSSDGSVALIGAPGKNTKTGAAYAFVGSGGTWVQEPEMITSDGVDYDVFGTAVTLSSDGNTALIGAPGRNGFTGEVHGGS